MKTMLLALCAIISLPIAAFAQLEFVDMNVNNYRFTGNEEEAIGFVMYSLHLSPEFSFKLKGITRDTTKVGVWENHNYQQYYNGYPINYAGIGLEFKNGWSHSIGGTCMLRPPENVPMVPRISEEEALKIALATTPAKKYLWDDPEALQFLYLLPDELDLIYPSPRGRLMIHVGTEKDPGKVNLIYKFYVIAIDTLTDNYVFINANTGEVVGKENQIRYAAGTADTRYSGQRTIETESNNNSYRLYDLSRGSSIRTKNLNHLQEYQYLSATDFTDANNIWTAAEYHNSAKDDAGLDAHWGAMMAYDYFYNVHGRNGMVDNGPPTWVFFHWGNNVANAGQKANGLFFGDGAAGVMDAAVSLDIVAHEFGHGVCKYSYAKLDDSGEPGAIAEGLGDIWGACVENYATTGRQTWLIGEEVEQRSGHIALRSMSNPNVENCPDTYGGDFWDNNGEVHTNSTIMSHWFYLLSVGGTGTNDLNNAFDVAPIGMTDAAKIVYLAETGGDKYMDHATNYAKARVATIRAAQDIFGLCSPQVKSAVNAWYAVGVGKSYDQIANRVLTNNINQYKVEDHYATNSITASNVVQNHATVKYEATGSVELINGFQAEYGSDFLVRIVPCRDISEMEAAGSQVARNTVEPEPLNALLKIYPNPAHDVISVSLRGDAFRHSQIRLFDALGRIVADVSPESNLTQISVSGLSSGVYHCCVNAGGQFISLPIIKQ